MLMLRMAVFQYFGGVGMLREEIWKIRIMHTMRDILFVASGAGLTMDCFLSLRVRVMPGIK